MATNPRPRIGNTTKKATAKKAASKTKGKSATTFMPMPKAKGTPVPMPNYKPRTQSGPKPVPMPNYTPLPKRETMPRKSIRGGVPAVRIGNTPRKKRAL